MTLPKIIFMHFNSEGKITIMEDLEKVKFIKKPRIKLKMAKFRVKLKHLRKKYKHQLKGINNEID